MQKERGNRMSAARVFLAAVRRMEPAMLQQLATLVQMESPSHDKDAVDGVVAEVAKWGDSLGGKVHLHRFRNVGDSLEIRFGPARSNRKPILLLGHLDTVWEHGTLKRMPWRVTKDRVYGPGVFDMKAGVVMMFTALRLLHDSNLIQRPIILLLHGDEEIGSPQSRKVTEAVARRCEAVYVLEPAQGEIGAYKTARKGVGQYRIEVRGVAAHSGVDFARGHSAIVELARQIPVIEKIIDPSREITVNPGLIGGGTRVNVVAEEAWVEVDVRIARASDAAKVDRAMHRLRPFDKSCELAIRGGVNRPPMERTAATAALFGRAREFAKEIGVDLHEASTGGGSDGNFTAALGIPTLDGMGAVGAGAHAPHEHCLRRELAPRTALLAALLQ
jgi:glutamate carboxypeptidase